MGTMMYFRIAGVLFSMLLIMAYFLVPPLSTKPPAEAVNYAATRFLSEPAQAGQTAFGERCSECHGEIGEGMQGAPNLTDRDYAVDYRDAEAFHSAIGRDIPAHRDIIAAAHDAGRLDFNELQLMAKFLREIRRKKDRDAREQ